MTIRVAVIEEHLLVLQALSAMLRAHPVIEVVAACTDGSDCLRLVKQARPDVVIFDFVSRTRKLDPVAAVDVLKRTCPGVEILALLDRDDGVSVRGIIEAGARGCLLRDDEHVLSLAEVACRIAAGERVYSQEVVERYFDLPDTALTPQELAMLRLASEGMSNNAIAERLVMASSTVRNRISSIYGKLGTSREAGVNPRVHAINKARQLGLL